MAMDGELLNNSSGRVLYTDNYYTSESLMEMMHTKYNAFVVGTTAMTKKKSRTKDDFPFHKLSGPMKKRTPRGWLRWAQKKVLDAAGNLLYVIQGTTWMDRKQVAVLHNWRRWDLREIPLHYDIVVTLVEKKQYQHIQSFLITFNTCVVLTGLTRA